MRLPLLDQLPSWATTGIGSLPHADPAAAVEYLTLAYAVPFCPQLPRHDGDMVHEWLGDVAARRTWTPERAAREPAAWPAFLRELERRPPAHGVVKLQLTGPVTLGCAIDRATDASAPAGTPSPRTAELATWLADAAAEAVDAVRERGPGVVLVLDEPALGLCAHPGIEAAWAPLRDLADAWGLHCCCEVPWDVVDAAAPDLLSLDLAFTPVDGRAARSLDALAARGAWVAWGAIAAHRPEYALHGIRRVTAAVEAVPRTEGRSLLTASCGTGRMSVERERQVAVALRDVAGTMRRRADAARATAP
ncbi:hypothetical protein GKE82_10105 [Conexibacter sp. W3-3-2]|uniref:hypothetical protein n=1 Tax=Conexibacter sp. W3-3-2 TaxID=2675227 RepID=UPI0012B84815|nr:hypothetical protein [Conexibacter sp. W3-3-2]MTD44631.1 hypothetical protein [Conexibacter sp. W3-3-2]